MSWVVFLPHRADELARCCHPPSSAPGQRQLQVHPSSAPKRLYVTSDCSAHRLYANDHRFQGDNATVEPYVHPELKAAFANGVESTLAALEEKYQAGLDAPQQDARAKKIDLLAHAIGAVMLSRACPDDSPIADEILETCRTEMMTSLPLCSKKSPDE